jgi:hypothetical protein
MLICAKQWPALAKARTQMPAAGRRELTLFV